MSAKTTCSVDLLDAIRGLGPCFIRWPRSSFASTYKWKEAIGPYAARGYRPNVYWGNYSDYAIFGTDEFVGLCKRLNCEPLSSSSPPQPNRGDIDCAVLLARGRSNAWSHAASMAGPIFTSDALTTQKSQAVASWEQTKAQSIQTH